MAKKEINSSNNSISFGGLLAILFIALKLTGVIDWSWVWVLSPLWIGIALVVLFLAVVFVVEIIKKWGKK